MKMKAVYLFSDTEAVKKILRDDKFMRISYVIKIGEILVNASEDEVKLLEEEFTKIGVKRAEKVKEDEIIKRIEAQEENSAYGMGLMFG